MSLTVAHVSTPRTIRIPRALGLGLLLGVLNTIGVALGCSGVGYGSRAQNFGVAFVYAIGPGLIGALLTTVVAIASSTMSRGKRRFAIVSTALAVLIGIGVFMQLFVVIAWAIIPTVLCALYFEQQTRGSGR